MLFRTAFGKNILAQYIKRLATLLNAIKQCNIKSACRNSTRGKFTQSELVTLFAALMATLLKRHAAHAFHLTMHL